MPSNNINIKSVVVIGAGVMGAQLAALFANKGIRSYLYDITTDTATLITDLTIELATNGVETSNILTG